jgi:transposase
MGRGRDLTGVEIAQIGLLRDNGWSLRQIAMAIERTPTAVRNGLKKIEDGVVTRRTGRECSLSERTQRSIIRTASNKCITAKRIKADLNLPCSPSTVRRVIKKSGIIVYRKKRRKPILSGLQRATRVAWARERLHWTNKWKDIVFSDEKKFNLDGPDNNAFYYHDIRKRELLQDKRHSGGGSVMVWAAIGWRGKSSVAFLEGTQDSLKYQQTLEEFLCGARIGGNRWIFMHDNAPIHASASTRAWLADRHVRVLPWPARSPDLNPIENVWSAMSRMVYADGKQYSTIDELKTAILCAWARISAEYRHKLYNSMRKRLLSVIDDGGMISTTN